MANVISSFCIKPSTLLFDNKWTVTFQVLTTIQMVDDRRQNGEKLKPDTQIIPF